MARTESNLDLPLGSICPDFELQDTVSGHPMTRDSLLTAKDGADREQGLLVAFLCVHCPFVKHMEEAFARLADEYSTQIATVAFSSNDIVAYPEDAPEHMREQANRHGWRFPYLLDETQDTARAFHAACTPDLYLFDSDLRLVYHGQFDETRPYRQSDANSGVVKDERIHQAATGIDLRRAIEALLHGEMPLERQVPCLGCNIKWRE